MLVYLLRHGIAADLAPRGPQTDEERPLTAAGREKLTAACSTYASVATCPTRILASPLIRAQQTARVFADATGFDGEIESEPVLVPGARPLAILDTLRAELLSGASAIALVGHEPHLGGLLGLLLTGGERISIPLRKGMLVGVQLSEHQTMIGDLKFAIGQGLAQRLCR